MSATKTSRAAKPATIRRVGMADVKIAPPTDVQLFAGTRLASGILALFSRMSTGASWHTVLLAR